MLRESVIQTIISKAKNILAELNEYKKYGYGRNTNKKVLIDQIIERNYYLKLISETGSIQNGIPCYRCKKMIEPGSYCYSKIKKRKIAQLSFYYHRWCYECLYQE